MKFLPRIAFALALGGALSAASAFLLPIQPAAFPRFSFPPDLAMLLAGQVRWMLMLNAAIGAAAMAFAFTSRDRRFAAIALALVNPLALYGAALGAAALFTATAILMHAFFAHAVERDHASTARLGVAAAFSPLLCNSTILLAPGILLTAMLFSPWRGGRRLAGYATAIFAPAVMMFLAILYLCWLIGEPAAPLQRAAIVPPATDVALVLGGAALVAAAACARSLIAGVGAVAAGAAILAWARPDLVARIVEQMR